MKSGFKFSMALIALGLLSTVGTAQQRRDRAGADKSLMQRFDSNGDGQIDDQERRSVREKIRQMQNKPGAMTPSGKTETVGGRLVTEMQYASSDGRMIPCVLSMPPGDGPFPVLVTIHGGQGNRDLGYIRTMAAPNNLSPTVTAFNEQPWAILAISYRAGNGALFGMEQDDVIAGIRFAKTLPKVDRDRVGVVGGSHGGHLALVAAEKMGREFLCVAVGSPWMTDPVVYMMGDPAKPPLSLVRESAREDLMQNGRRILNGMQRGRGMSAEQLQVFIREHSIEANASQIEVPTLFITSRGDDQAPHVLIEPMIKKMQQAKQDVQVYTAEKSPHGFYWARTVSAARDLRGEKTQQEAAEELAARKTIIEFFTKQFARTDAQTEKSRSASERPAGPEPEPEPEPQPASQPQDSEESDSESPAKSTAGKITRDAFRKQFGSSAALADKPELADRLFDRLDADGDGELSDAEHDGLDALRSQFSRGGNRPGMNRGNMSPGRPPAQRPSPGTAPRGASRSAPAEPAARPVAAKTAPVQISSGSLVGEQAGDVRIFRGIPYATAPLGDRRWQAPQPPQPWTDVRDATQFGAPALQGEAFTPRSAQSEDCLFLNIWTPTGATEQSQLPVLFWIHGGAFIQGSGAQPRYDGTELAKRGAVVITINYRLGPIGLFAHPALTAASKPNEPLGNYCLLDMLAALHWTQQNIASFGGNPGNVTISGSSAGGTSCLFLMGITEAKGLFHKAIIHSSGGIQNIQTLAEAEAAGVRLAEHLGLGPSPTPAQLRDVPAGDLAVGVGSIRQLDLPVKPLIDGRLVRAAPADSFAEGKQHRIPVMIGAANGESGARQLNDEVATGGAFGFQRQLADHMQRAGQRVWMFQLTYVPPQARAGHHAAQHGETVAYAFGTFGQSVAAQYGFRKPEAATKAARAGRGGGREDDSLAVEDSEQGRLISAAMLEYWVTFMRDGTPGGADLPAWPAYSPDSPRTMVFGNSGIAAR
jgi:para-nitrobenzyl esterase